MDIVVHTLKIGSFLRKIKVTATQAYKQGYQLLNVDCQTGIIFPMGGQNPKSFNGLITICSITAQILKW